MGLCCSVPSRGKQFEILRKKFDKLWLTSWRKSLMLEGRINEDLGIKTDELNEQEIVDWIYEWIKSRVGQMTTVSICLSRPPLVAIGVGNYGYQCHRLIKLYRGASRSVAVSVSVQMTIEENIKGLGYGFRIPFHHYYGEYKVYPLDECSICMENECQVMDAGCGHMLYCLNCYLDLVRTYGEVDGNGTGYALEECPICREPRRQLVYVRSDYELDAIQI